LFHRQRRFLSKKHVVCRYAFVNAVSARVQGSLKSDRMSPQALHGAPDKKIEETNDGCPDG
jgi:hypothetical protein